MASFVPLNRCQSVLHFSSSISFIIFFNFKMKNVLISMETMWIFVCLLFEFLFSFIRKNDRPTHVTFKIFPWNLRAIFFFLRKNPIDVSLHWHGYIGIWWRCGAAWMPILFSLKTRTFGFICVCVDSSIWFLLHFYITNISASYIVLATSDVIHANGVPFMWNNNSNAMADRNDKVEFAEMERKAIRFGCHS